MSKVKQTVFVVFEVAEPKDELIGSRLTLEAAVSLCKLAPNRYWKKTVATKEIGSSKFDNAKQQEKQHGTETDQSAQAV